MSKMIKLIARIDYNKSLFTPDPKNNKYGCRLILDAENTDKLKQEIEDFKKEFPTIKKWKPMSKVIMDASEKYDDNDSVHGCSYINAKSGVTHEPYKVSRSRRKVEAEDVDVYFYSGCKVTAFISLFKYVYDGNGIGFGLTGLQSHETGERLFTGGSMPEPEFDELPPIDVDDMEDLDY